MTERSCGGCGQPLGATTTICSRCGWDLTTSVCQPQRRSLARFLAGGSWRLACYGLLLVAPILGFVRLRVTGPGPDLATTLHWMMLGDGGRAAELVTIHRMHEIATAAARYTLQEQEPPDFAGDWARLLAPYATMNVRGFIPLLFCAADSQAAPASVREPFTVRAVDGWGRPLGVACRALPEGVAAGSDPEVVADLDEGLQTSFFASGQPDFSTGDWLRLSLGSAGADGAWGSGDDLSLVSYLPAGYVLKLGLGAGDLQRSLEHAFTVGRHYFRVEGSRFDLIDARLLVEFRLDSVA